MMRRLLVVAVLLLTVVPAAMAKRRAISPRAPSSCSFGTLVPATYASLLARDDQFVYLIDEMGMLSRVPKNGGEVQPLAEVGEMWLPLAMEVDATTVYISALPFEAIFAPLPGAILALPKNGGVIEVLASGVETAFALGVDETHVYWAAAGILDFNAGEFRPGGKIERMKSDGSGRETLVPNLSAPLGLALDGDAVYIAESGFAAGHLSFGLHRVAKSGGRLTTLSEEIIAASIAIDGPTIVILGATESAAGILALEKAGPGAPRVLLEDEFLAFSIRATDRRAYVIAEHEATELLSVAIDAPGDVTVVRSELGGDAFLLDECAAIVNTMDGDVSRVAR